MMLNLNQQFRKNSTFENVIIFLFQKRGKNKCAVSMLSLQLDNLMARKMFSKRRKIYLACIDVDLCH